MAIYRKAVSEEGTADTDDDENMEIGANTTDSVVRGGGSGASRTGFYRSRKQIFGEYKNLLAIEKHTAVRSMAVITRPVTGTNKNNHYWDDVQRNYVQCIDLVEAEANWKAEWQKGAGPAAKVKRAYPLCLLSGSVTPFYPALESLVQSSAMGLSKEQEGLASLRLELVDGRRLVGVRWPPELADVVQGHLQNAARKSGLLMASIPSEVPTPIDAASAKRARAAPKTITSFFSRHSSPPAMAVDDCQMETDVEMARRLQQQFDRAAESTSTASAPSKRNAADVVPTVTSDNTKRVKKVCPFHLWKSRRAYCFPFQQQLLTCFGPRLYQ